MDRWNQLREWLAAEIEHDQRERESDRRETALERQLSYRMRANVLETVLRRMDGDQPA